MTFCSTSRSRGNPGEELVGVGKIIDLDAGTVWGKPLKDYPFDESEAAVTVEADCTPEELRQQQRIAKYKNFLGAAGIPPISHAAHLQTNCKIFETHQDKSSALGLATTLAKNRSVQQPDGDKYGLLICGSYGAGKTWLATAAFKEWLWQGEKGLWTKYYSMISEIQDSYTNGNSKNVIQKFQQCDSLLIDDVGEVGGRQSDDKRELLYQVLDHRNSYRLPTILTTNLSGNEMAAMFGERLMNRILELCAMVKMDGDNFRLKPPSGGNKMYEVVLEKSAPPKQTNLNLSA